MKQVISKNMFIKKYQEVFLEAVSVHHYDKDFWMPRKHGLTITDLYTLDVVLLLSAETFRHCTHFA